MTYLSHVHLKTHFLLMVIYYETDIHESKIRYLKSIKNFCTILLIIGMAIQNI